MGASAVGRVVCILVTTIKNYLTATLAVPILLNVYGGEKLCSLPNNHGMRGGTVPHVKNLLFVPSVLMKLAITVLVRTHSLRRIAALGINSVVVTINTFLVCVVKFVSSLVRLGTARGFVVRLITTLLVPFY